MGNSWRTSNQAKQYPISQIRAGVDPESDAERLPWAWLLVIAPGRLITFSSPHPPIEVEHRLQMQSPHLRSIGDHHLALALPNARTARRFFAWIESDQDGRTRLSGQTRTPYRTAAARLGIGVAMCGLALMFLAGAHGWLAFMFAAGGTGYMLLSQYERLTERDVRLYTAWLRQAIDAEPIQR